MLTLYLESSVNTLLLGLLLSLLLRVARNLNYRKSKIGMARVVWKKETVAKILKHMAEKDTHEEFIRKKKCNQLDDWHERVGEKFDVAGSKVRDLMKNLGKEYRGITQKTLLSGMETEEKTLKGSSEIFYLYEAFLELYYPKGSAVKPQKVLTESLTSIRFSHETAFPFLLIARNSPARFFISVSDKRKWI